MNFLWIDQIKGWARRIKSRLVVLYYALRDPRAPWSARLVGALTVAYALSPIDLIPDIIPVLGMLDDVLIVPAGIWCAWRLLPEALRHEYTARAAELPTRLPQNRWAAAVIILLWLALVAWLAAMGWTAYQGGAVPEK